MKSESKTYVWGVPTRLFHWLLVISLAGAYIAVENNITAHVALGYMAGLLMIFRLIWGLVGPAYVRFRDFPVGVRSIKQFLSDIRGNGQKHAGHNPAASLVMIGIMLMVVMVVFSGLMTLSQEGGQGVFKSVGVPAGIEFKEVHEFWVQVLIALTVLHLIGLIVDTILHPQTGTLKSMFSGYKTGISGENASMSGFQKFFSFVWIAAPLLAFILTITGPPVILNEGEEESQSTETRVSEDEAHEQEEENE